MANIKSKLDQFLVLVFLITLLSCGKSASELVANAEGFEAIEEKIKSKFGDNAYYTDLIITHDTSLGNWISVTVTENPESLKMGQWNLTQNSWKQNSEISLEVPKGSKAADFMFQLDERINLSKLGELIEKSITQLKTEKNIENTTLYMAFVKFPKNGDITKTEYSINLKQEKGSTTFRFFYTIEGNLIKMDY